MTASLPIINVLLGQRSLGVISLGGTLHHDSQSFTGPMPLAAIKEFRMRSLVLGASGLTVEGVYRGNHFDAVTKRALVSVADEVILVTDSSKFSISAMVRACSLDDVDVIVTDEGLPDENRAALLEHDVEIITVPAEEEPLDGPPED